MKIYFIGAGPGDPELLTLKAKRILGEVDVIVYAGSLINMEIMKFRKEGAVLHDSSSMELDEILRIFSEARREGKSVARLHSGDLSIYSTLQEQLDWCEKEGIETEVIPGISAFQAASASLKQELTLPGVCQTLILTRISGRTEAPLKEDLENLARSRATMAIFLSIQEIERVVEKLRASYEEETPVSVIEKASWPEERKIMGTIKDIVQKVKEAGIKRQALMVVGDIFRKNYRTSKLYDGKFEHGFRKRKGVCE